MLYINSDARALPRSSRAYAATWNAEALVPGALQRGGATSAAEIITTKLARPVTAIARTMRLVIGASAVVAPSGEVVAGDSDDTSSVPTL
jgi:hypothetical protein